LSIVKEELHQLVDALPEKEKYFLRFRIFRTNPNKSFASH